MAEELRTEIGRAKKAWPKALRAAGDDPTKQPHSETPVSVDASAFGVGVNKLRTGSLINRPVCSNSENRDFVGKKSGNGDDGPFLNAST